MSLEISFKGKNILVTGAAAGIGLALCTSLHSLGANVYALDLNKDSLLKLQQLLPTAKIICVNLQDWDASRKLVKDLAETMDGLVNNAGIGIDETFMKTQPDSFDKVFAVNVKAIINISQVVALKMIERGLGGSIVNVSSLASRFGTRVSIPYNVSKSAVDMLTKAMALELGPHNIRVNSINPNIVMTDLAREWMRCADGQALKHKLIARTPLGRICEIEEVVNTILFLLSDSAPMIHGEHVFLDGGYSAF